MFIGVIQMAFWTREIVWGPESSSEGDSVHFRTVLLRDKGTEDEVGPLSWPRILLVCTGGGIPAN